VVPPPEVEFGDEVRIVSTPDTDARAYAGRIGVCKGVTTPSYSGVEVIGEAPNDRALSVRFDDTGEEVWFSADLVEFVSCAEGTVIGIGDKTFRRNADGSWSSEQG
jgi:hypothetical protein